MVNSNDQVQKIDWVDTSGLALWAAIKEHGLEGMVGKRKNGRYIPGQRSSAWVKVKNYQKAMVTVMGYKLKDGHVLVGTDGKTQGHAIGMRGEDKVILNELLNNYGREQGNTILLPPGIKGCVKYTTLTPRGNMRDCCWVGFESSCSTQELNW